MFLRLMNWRIWIRRLPYSLTTQMTLCLSHNLPLGGPGSSLRRRIWQPNLLYILKESVCLVTFFTAHPPHFVSSCAVLIVILLSCAESGMPVAKRLAYKEKLREVQDLFNNKYSRLQFMLFVYHIFEKKKTNKCNS